MKAMELLALCALAGCVSSGNPAIRDEAVVEQIKTGITTKEEVRKLLGKPNSIGRGSGNLPPGTGIPHTAQTNYEVWTYKHISVETHPATFIPIVGLFAGGATSDVNTVTIYFDDKGIAQYLQTSQSQGTSRMGGNRQGPPRSQQESQQELH